MRCLSWAFGLAAWLASSAALAQAAPQDLPLSHGACSFVHPGSNAIESLSLTHAVFEACPSGRAQGWVLYGARSRLRLGGGLHPFDLVNVGYMRDGRFVGAHLTLLEIGGFVNVSSMSRARTFQKSEANYSLAALLELIASEARTAGAPNQAEAVRVMSDAARQWDAEPGSYVQRYMQSQADDRPARGRSGRGG